jgi:hypothetical protein
MATATAANASPKPRKRASDVRAAGSRVVLRAAIAVAALLVAAAAVANLRSNARIALDSAREQVEHGTSPTDPAVQSLAREALRRDPTLTGALELLALADEQQGDHRAAAGLYQLSDRISRRSLATRLWLIQDAVGRGDVSATLGNMDLALRTSSAAPPFVLPALARGLGDPKLVAPIAAMVDRPSDWREGFLIYAADNAEPAADAALFFALHDRRAIVKDQLDRKVIVRLVGAGQFRLARQLDTAFGGGPAGASAVADGQFGDPSARYPFGWGLTDTAELGAARENERGHSVLAYHANVAEGGQVAGQLLTLAPGSYRLETQAAPAADSGTAPQWTLSCAAPTRLIATLALLAAQQASVSFSVPPDCPAQWLVLTVRPVLAPQAGSVERVAITAR